MWAAEEQFLLITNISVSCQGQCVFGRYVVSFALYVLTELSANRSKMADHGIKRNRLSSMHMLLVIVTAWGG